MDRCRSIARPINPPNCALTPPLTLLAPRALQNYKSKSAIDKEPGIPQKRMHLAGRILPGPRVGGQSCEQQQSVSVGLGQAGGFAEASAHSSARVRGGG